MNTNSLLSNPNNYKRTRKKKYTIVASMPPKGTKVTNFLEKVDYTTDEAKKFVLTGTVGEQWVIDVNKLCKTYTFEDGTPITKEALSKKVVTAYNHELTEKYSVITPFRVTSLPGVNNWAVFVPLGNTFPIQTSWGDTLICNAPGVRHGVGDYIVCSDLNGRPNLNDMWVVNGEIFPSTYDMRSFPNMKWKNSKVAPPDNGAESKLWREHPEFKGIVVNHDTVEILNKGLKGHKTGIRDKEKSLRSGAYKQSLAKINYYVRKRYPGKFMMPKLGEWQYIMIIPHSDMKSNNIKKGIEIKFSQSDIKKLDEGIENMVNDESIVDLKDGLHNLLVKYANLRILIYNGKGNAAVAEHSEPLYHFDINRAAKFIETSVAKYKL